jgi:hypothetical protein
MDPDDDAWLPPMGDDGPADRGEMFKAFGFNTGGVRSPTDQDDNAPRGFMSFDEEGEDRPEGGLNNFFMARPDGGDRDEGDRDEGAPMAGGAKDFFFAARPGTDDAQASEPTRESQSQPAQQSEEAPAPSFFNPTETAPAAETETPQSGFFKPEAEPPSTENGQAPQAAFFANVAAPTTLSSSATRPSFFNPEGLTTNPFPGGSGNNEVREDSEVEGDRDREVETND